MWADLCCLDPLWFATKFRSLVFELYLSRVVSISSRSGKPAKTMSGFVWQLNRLISSHNARTFEAAQSRWAEYGDEVDTQAHYEPDEEKPRPFGDLEKRALSVGPEAAHMNKTAERKRGSCLIVTPRYQRSVYATMPS